MCIKDLKKLNLIWRFDFRLEPGFAAASAFPENSAYFKSGQKWLKNDSKMTQKWLKNDNIAAFTKVKSHSLIYYVAVFFEE